MVLVVDFAGTAAHDSAVLAVDPFQTLSGDVALRVGFDPGLAALLVLRWK